MVAPGPVRTGFAEEATAVPGGDGPYAGFMRGVAARNSTAYDRPDARGTLDAEDVAEVIVTALESGRPKARYPVGFVSRRSSAPAGAADRALGRRPAPPVPDAVSRVAPVPPGAVRVLAVTERRPSLLGRALRDESARPLRVSPLNAQLLTVGVDIGGTKVAAGVVTHEGEVLAQVRRETPHRSKSPQVVEDTIVDAVLELAQEHEMHAVGIGAAGFIDADRANVLFAPHLSWRNEPLREAISSRLRLPGRRRERRQRRGLGRVAVRGRPRRVAPGLRRTSAPASAAR